MQAAMQARIRSRLGQWAAYLDPVYIGNRLAYLSLTQGAFLGEEFPSGGDAAQSYPHDRMLRTT